jgi:hypothetical protein
MTSSNRSLPLGCRRFIFSALTFFSIFCCHCLCLRAGLGCSVIDSLYGTINDKVIGLIRPVIGIYILLQVQTRNYLNAMDTIN